MALATHILWLECGVSNPSIDDELCKRSYIVSVRVTASLFRDPILMKWEGGREAINTNPPINTKASAAPEPVGSRSAGGRI
jgi:hypothetical protein